MRTVRWLPLSIFAICIAGCGVAGSGKVITESRNVNGFNAIEFEEDGNLLVEQTGSESLTITADDNLLPYLTSEVIGRRLIIRNKDRTNLRPTRTVDYKLTVKTLNDLRLSSDGKIDARGINSDSLRISISGDGELKAVGNVEKQEIHISGDGTYQGGNLTGKAARVEISGDGRAVLAVSDKLDANISGDGHVEYIGNPAVTQHISGDGTIRRR